MGLYLIFGVEPVLLFCLIRVRIVFTNPKQQRQLFKKNFITKKVLLTVYVSALTCGILYKYMFKRVKVPVPGSP